MTEILSGANPACKLAHRAKLAVIMSYSTTAIGIIVLLKMPYNIDKFSQLYIYIYISGHLVIFQSMAAISYVGSFVFIGFQL